MGINEWLRPDDKEIYDICVKHKLLDPIPEIITWVEGGIEINRGFFIGLDNSGFSKFKERYQDTLPSWITQEKEVHHFREKIRRIDLFLQDINGIGLLNYVVEEYKKDTQK